MCDYTAWHECKGVSCVLHGVGPATSKTKSHFMACQYSSIMSRAGLFQLQSCSMMRSARLLNQLLSL